MRITNLINRKLVTIRTFIVHGSQAGKEYERQRKKITSAYLVLFIRETFPGSFFQKYFSHISWSKIDLMDTYNCKKSEEVMDFN